jgi:enoyl-CoA hydratase/carnithine racemase
VLRTEDTGPVRVLTLNRPASRNALSGELFIALHAALRDADADPGVRAIVLTGPDPAFCAGIDLKQAAADGKRFFDLIADHDCITAAGAMRMPVVGAINGPAFTGGLELALGCDLLIGSLRAVFADTHVRVGVLPGGGLTARLPLLVGGARARRMSMTGEIVDAARALRIGLLTEVARATPERALYHVARIAEVEPRMMLGIKQVYGAAEATVAAPALAACRIGAANQPAYDEIELRRQEVLSRNRSALARRKETTPPELRTEVS